MIFTTLSLSFMVFGSIGWSIAARSRGFWLTGARSRNELRAWCERVMLRVLLATAAPFVVLGSALWWFIRSVRRCQGATCCLAMTGPALTAAWVGLMQVQYRLLPDLTCGFVMLAGMWTTLLHPMITGGGPRWDLLGAQFALVCDPPDRVWRWRAADWPRNQRVPGSEGPAFPYFFGLRNLKID